MKFFNFLFKHFVLSNTKKTSETLATKTNIDESSKNYNLFEDVLNNCVLFYEYEENMYLDNGAVNLITGHGGEELTFVKEINNEYDENAIAIYYDNTKIGYVYKGLVQNMINDWIERNETFTGYINKIFINNNNATYKIGFYKPLDNFKHKTFSLVKTNKKIDKDFTREDNIYNINEGDDVIIEFDYELDSYVVFNNLYEEIGELSNTSKSFIENDDFDRLIGIVTDFTYDDNDNPKLKITVYLIN